MKKQRLVSPQEGQGLHEWFQHQSRALLIQGYSPEKVFQILLEASSNSGRTTQDIETEIWNLINGALEYFEENPSALSGTQLGKQARFSDPLDFCGLDDPHATKDSRPIRVPVNPEYVKYIREKEPKYFGLNEGNELEKFSFRWLFANLNFDIAVCKEMHSPIIKPLKELELDLNCVNYQYIVPNSMWDPKGSRSILNVSERLFIVVEFDNYDKDYQWLAANFLQRRGMLNLALIVDSGSGRSLHSWFPCYNHGVRLIKNFCRLAAEIGADQTTDNPAQWVRMPNGYNIKKQKHQHVLWFSSENLSFQCQMMREELKK